MSTFQVCVVEIGKFGKHPNADTLSICQVQGNNVIFRTGDYETGSRAIYLPEESLVPNSSEFAFLWADRTKENKEVREKDRVVWARKLRGIFSCGLLIPIPEILKDVPSGTDVASVLGITKYEQAEVANTGGDNEKNEGWMVKFTEIENLRRYSDVLIPGETIVCTEKVHGSNARYCFHDGNLHIGSHNNIKRKDGKNIWHKVAERLNFDAKLRAYPDKIFFGEVYGTVQKGFGYNLKENTFILFDIFDLNQNKYLDWPEVVAIGEQLELRMVPVIYSGSWVSVEHLEPLAEGTTIVGDGKHIREGVVLRTYPERWDNNIGRVCLKLVGKEYLCQKKNHA